MTDGPDIRELVLDILLEVMERGRHSHVALREALTKYQYLDKRQRSFLSRVSLGTLEYLYQIDAVLNQISKVPVKRMKPVICNLLRMSVYQIWYMDRVPVSAVCNEAVKLAAKRRFKGLGGYVNGVLRNVARMEALPQWEDEPTRLCLPQWLYDMWEKNYGAGDTERMAQAFLQRASTTVRCHYSLASRQAILDSLKAQKVTVHSVSGFEDMLLLEHYDYLEDLEAFSKGWIQVQDVSSSLVGRAAAPKKGDLVIDVCSAPGGKALHMAELLEGTGLVDARDVSWQKVELIEENIHRLGFENIKTKVWDALKLDEACVETADIVLADLPCSGLGILRRKPDIRYKMSLDQTKELAQLQRNMLSVVCRYVKPGGLFIYSTCTINPAENEENAIWIENHLGLKPVDLSDRLGAAAQGDSCKKGRVQLLPGIHPWDGFFLAAFRK